MIGTLKIRMPDGTVKTIPAVRGEKGDKGDKGDTGEPGTTCVMPGEGECSVIGGENNQAISDYSVALGKGNIAGYKGYYIKSIDVENKKIYLTDIKMIPAISTADNTDNNFEAPKYEQGDKFSVIVKLSSKRDHFHFIGTITSVLNNVITYSGNLPFTEISSDDEETTPTFFVPGKPLVGIALWTEGGMASGLQNIAAGKHSYTTGRENIAAGDYSFVSGRENIAAYASLAGGHRTEATGNCSTSLGKDTKAKGECSDAGNFMTEAIGYASTARGYETKARGASSFSHGKFSKSLGECSDAGNYSTEASGFGATARGYGTKAIGAASFACGDKSEARGKFTHVEGTGTIATASAQHVQGMYNIIDENEKYLDIVGNGKSNDERSNAYTLDKEGNAWFAGRVTTGENNDKLVTETEVLQMIQSAIRES